MSLISIATLSSFKTKVEIQLKIWNAPFAASDFAASSGSLHQRVCRLLYYRCDVINASLLSLLLIITCSLVAWKDSHSTIVLSIAWNHFIVLTSIFGRGKFNIEEGAFLSKVRPLLLIQSIKNG
jgi:hypothetical protein